MNEEDALIEEQAFMENLTKAELRESRALCSSLRTKLKYYGDEIARLRLVTMVVQHQQVTHKKKSIWTACCKHWSSEASFLVHMKYYVPDDETDCI